MSLTVDDGSPVTTDYVWDVNRSLPVILDDGTFRYAYGLDLISQVDSSNNHTYFLYDGLGSTVALADTDGDITDTYEYDVFGAIRASTGSSTNPWLFTGEQYDPDSELYYLRARFYDPATGRFLGLDPLLLGNRYSYVGNNPVNYIDPYGLLGIPGTGIDVDVPDPTGMVDDVVDVVGDAVTEAVDQINITAEGVFVGTVLVFVGGALVTFGALGCVAVAAEVENPALWPVIPHSAGVCTFMIATGGIIYICGWSLILTSWCGVALPADTAEAPGAEATSNVHPGGSKPKPAGTGKE